MINEFPPKNKGYTYLQMNRGDDVGSIWSSMGLDFQSNLGVMQVGQRMLRNTSSNSRQSAPCAFKYIFGSFWCIWDTRIFMGGATPEATFTQDTSTNTQTGYSQSSDMELFNGQLFTTTTTGLFSLDAGGGAGTWTDRTGGTALDNNTLHMMTYFKKFNRLYVIGTDEKVYSYDTSYTQATTGDYTLDLATNDQFSLTCIKASSNRIWLGAIGFQNRLARGRIYEWDGVSNQITNEYILNANACIAIVINNDIPYAMDSEGRLLRFTGSSFEEIGRLPMANLDSINVINAAGFIHPNGLLATKNDTILALVNNVNYDNGATVAENFPAGIWEFSNEFGVTHKHAISYTNVGTSTITDYGQYRLSSTGNVVGALINADIQSNAAGRNGTIMCGVRYQEDASSNRSGIFINDSNNTLIKKGYFVTTWFNSNEISDEWTRLWLVYKRLLGTTDSIVMKYRLYEEDPILATITWTSSTTFTTTTDITAYGPNAAGFSGITATGGEVEILRGTGGGACVHITNIVNNVGTYTVTIDTSLPGVFGTAQARFQKWIRLFPSAEASELDSYKQMAIGFRNTRIQLKGCLTFTDNGGNTNEFSKLIVVSNEDIKITN